MHSWLVWSILFNEIKRCHSNTRRPLYEWFSSLSSLWPPGFLEKRHFITFTEEDGEILCRGGGGADPSGHLRIQTFVFLRAYWMSVYGLWPSLCDEINLHMEQAGAAWWSFCWHLWISLEFLQMYEDFSEKLPITPQCESADCKCSLEVWHKSWGIFTLT